MVVERRVVVVALLVLPSILAHNCSPPFETILHHWCVHVNVTLPKTDPGKALTWLEARAECKKQGGDLAVLDRHNIFQAVSHHLDHNYKVETEAGWIYWVGGSGKGAAWKWVDGANLNLNSHLWSPTHPDPASTDSSYAMLVPVDQEHGRRYLLPYSATQSAPAYICEQTQIS